MHTDCFEIHGGCPPAEGVATCHRNLRNITEKFLNRSNPPAVGFSKTECAFFKRAERSSFLHICRRCRPLLAGCRAGVPLPRPQELAGIYAPARGRMRLRRELIRQRARGRQHELIGRAVFLTGRFQKGAVLVFLKLGSALLIVEIKGGSLQVRKRRDRLAANALGRPNHHIGPRCRLSAGSSGWRLECSPRALAQGVLGLPRWRRQLEGPRDGEHDLGGQRRVEIQVDPHAIMCARPRVQRGHACDEPLSGSRAQHIVQHAAFANGARV